MNPACAGMTVGTLSVLDIVIPAQAGILWLLLLRQNRLSSIAIRFCTPDRACRISIAVSGNRRPK